MRIWHRIGVMVLLTAMVGGHSARAAEWKGVFRLQDQAQLFSSEGAKAARERFESATFSQTTHLTIVTVNQIPPDKQAEFDRIAKNPPERGRFFENWARNLAKAEKESGIFVLMYDDGSRFINRALADEKTSQGRGFGTSKLSELIAILDQGSKAALKQPTATAQEFRDQSLLKAVDFVIDGLKSSAKNTAAAIPELPAGLDPAAAQTPPWLSWLCIGIVLLLGVWMVIGLIRMMAGGMGGGGMSGGGFFTSLLGGLFGAAAGMYLYDQFFGSGANSASAADGSLGDASGADAGAGDWDRGATGGDAGGGDGGGGDFGGGDFGGGDW